MVHACAGIAPEVDPGYMAEEGEEPQADGHEAADSKSDFYEEMQQRVGAAVVCACACGWIMDEWLCTPAC